MGSSLIRAGLALALFCTSCVPPAGEQVVDIVEEYSTYTPPPTHNPVAVNTKAPVLTSPPTSTEISSIVLPINTALPSPTNKSTSLPAAKPISTKGNGSSDHKASSNGRDRIFGRYPCIENRAVRFTSIFFPSELITAIIPMGKVSPGSGHVTPTDHLYIHRDPPEGEDTEYVLAPADGFIVSIQRFPEDQPLIAGDWSSPNVPDHRVVIMHSCSLFTIFIHLGEFAEEIAEQTGDIPLNGNWSVGSSPAIEVHSEQPIAKFGGDSNDWSVHDADTKLTGFVVPEHYIVEEWKIHTVDPFQFYDEPTKSELLSKVIREVEPIAGKIDYDIEGTIAGNWFLDGTVDYSGNKPMGTPRYWEGHLYIGYGYIDPTQVRISIGFDTGISNDLCNICRGAYGVRGNEPHPDAVTSESGIIKYELMSRDEQSKWNREQVGVVSLGTLLVEHLGDRTIRMELMVSKSPEAVSGFSENSRIYKR